MTSDLTIDDWSAWTDDEVHAHHSCAADHPSEFAVLYRTPSTGAPAGWVLAYLEAATEDDVRKGIAPEMGVPARCMALSISFCPFCGSKLQAV